MVDITVSDFMKGRYNLMIHVGIDIGKLNHFASAISSCGTEFMKLFKITNDGNGFQLLNSRLVEFSYEDNSSIIGLKSTVHYSDNLVRYLVACNCNVCVEPHQKHSSYVRITSARPRRTKSTHTSLPEHI